MSRSSGKRGGPAADDLLADGRGGPAAGGRSATDSGGSAVGGIRGPATDGGFAGLRDPALLGIAVVLWSFLSVLYGATDVAGDPDAFLLVVVAALGLATVLGRFLRLRTAVFLSLVFVAGGLAAYVLSVPESTRALFTVERVIRDTIALLTGLSVLRLTEAGVWALAVAPGPAFLTWYLALRGRYAASAAVGGATLGFFVLTGDAGGLTTLAGVVGATLAVGLGDLRRRGVVGAQLDTLVIVVCAMIVLSALVSVVPGGSAQPLVPTRGGDGSTVEANVVGSEDSVEVVGSIDLSPKVRYVVESDYPANWGTDAYDRYTGDGWVRTGETDEFDGRLDGPPGSSRTVEQRVTARTETDALPAAWRPVAVEGAVGDTAQVTQQGTVRPGTTIRENESVTVRSEVPLWTAAQLRRAGDDYPEELEEAYTQLPASTSDRFHERTEEVAGDADNAYDAALAIERHLEENKEYSLDVERPEGDVAEAFLFEMDAGYCTYYATTMVAMLRSQGIPARFVTGYSTGQEVEDGRYVVRGLNAHAWVQVYFPEVGWVTFDPTPSAPREEVRQDRIADARQSDESGVDSDGSAAEPMTPTPVPDTEATPEPTGTEGTPEQTTEEPQGDSDGGSEDETNGDDGETTPPPGVAGPEEDEDADGDGGIVPEAPDREALGVWLALLVGLAAGARRTGATARVYRAIRLHYQGSHDDPDAAVERAFDRLELLLAREYRPRRPGETPRRYLRSLSNVGLDPRAREVLRTYERARYGGGVSRAEAEEAVRTVDALVRARTPLVRRFVP